MITCAKCRMVRGETQYNPVSRFVREIPPGLLDEEVPQGFRRVSPADFGLPVGGFPGKSFGSQRKGSSSYGNAWGGNASRAYARDNQKPQEAKPFIARETSRLNGLSAISKGGSIGSSQAPEYGVGDRVRHVKFGEGTVSAISKQPRDYMVTVEFDTYGQKIMYASFAKLKPV